MQSAASADLLAVANLYWIVESHLWMWHLLSHTVHIAVSAYSPFLQCKIRMSVLNDSKKPPIAPTTQRRRTLSHKWPQLVKISPEYCTRHEAVPKRSCKSRCIEWLQLEAWMTPCGGVWRRILFDLDSWSWAVKRWNASNPSQPASSMRGCVCMCVCQDSSRHTAASIERVIFMGERHWISPVREPWRWSRLVFWVF